jgi:hypothetical protein
MGRPFSFPQELQGSPRHRFIDFRTGEQIDRLSADGFSLGAQAVNTIARRKTAMGSETVMGRRLRRGGGGREKCGRKVAQIVG